jgi:hypothetical protein
MQIPRTDPDLAHNTGRDTVSRTCLGVFFISYGFCVQGLCVLLVQEAGEQPGVPC